MSNNYWLYFQYGILFSILIELICLGLGLALMKYSSMNWYGRGSSYYHKQRKRYKFARRFVKNSFAIFIIIILIIMTWGLFILGEINE
jgi:hypothetical protein